MRVLILNEFDEKAPFIKELATNLVAKGIGVSILDVIDHRLITYTTSDGAFQVEKLISNRLVNYVIRIRLFNILFKLIYYNWVCKLPPYDHVSYHYVGSIYLFFHRRFTGNRNVRSSAIVWGSDFYRSSFFDKKLKRRLYRKVDAIGMANPIMKEDFIRVHPESHSKIERVVFGIQKLEDIRKMTYSKSTEELRDKWKIDRGKTIITIGYNGRSQQQHIRILDELKESLASNSDRFHILIPFGYMGNENYKNEIATSLDNLQSSYTIIDWFCEDEEVAEYRLLTDIAINGQTTDALSASIQEHFYAGSVLLTGDWLPYSYFKELGLQFHDFSWESLHNQFTLILDNLQQEKNNSSENATIIWGHSSWAEVIHGWERLYSNNF